MIVIWFIKCLNNKNSLATQIITAERGFDTRQNTILLEHLFEKLIQDYDKMPFIDLIPDLNNELESPFSKPTGQDKGIKEFISQFGKIKKINFNR